MKKWIDRSKIRFCQLCAAQEATEKSKLSLLNLLNTQTFLKGMPSCTQDKMSWKAQ